MAWKPTKKQRLDALEHIAYEIEVFVCLGQQILTDGMFVTSPRVAAANAVLESFLLHARVLKDFFERKKRTCRSRKGGGKVTLRDVLVSDFAGPKAKKLPLPPGHRLRLDKDLAHLTYNRLDRIGDRSQWDVDEILKRVSKRCRKFAKAVVDGKALKQDLPEDLLSRWKNLLALLETRRAQSKGTGQQAAAGFSTETVQPPPKWGDS